MTAWTDYLATLTEDADYTTLTLTGSGDVWSLPNPFPANTFEANGTIAMKFVPTWGTDSIGGNRYLFMTSGGTGFGRVMGASTKPCLRIRHNNGNNNYDSTSVEEWVSGSTNFFCARLKTGTSPFIDINVNSVASPATTVTPGTYHAQGWTTLYIGSDAAGGNASSATLGPCVLSASTRNDGWNAAMMWTRAAAFSDLVTLWEDYMGAGDVLLIGDGTGFQKIGGADPAWQRSDFPLGALSLRFDDGPSGDVAKVATPLAANGLVGGFAIVRSYLDQSGKLSTDQALDIQAAGNEIMCHSRTHGSDPTNLTTGAGNFTDEAITAATEMRALGLNVRSFVQPGTWFDGGASGGTYNCQKSSFWTTAPDVLLRANYEAYEAYIPPITKKWPRAADDPYGATHDAGVPISGWTSAAILAYVKAIVNTVAAQPIGREILFHSAYIGDPGTPTVAPTDGISFNDWNTFLAYVAAKKAAGLITNPTPTGQLVPPEPPVPPPYVPPTGTFSAINIGDYDLTVQDSEGAGFGYALDWGQQSPFRLNVNTPDLSNSSMALTQSGAPYSVRDVTDYWRMEVSDWSGGAGQTSYDNDDSSPSKFLDSKNVVISKKGEITLGPGFTEYSSASANGLTISALGKVFAAFDPAGSDPRASIKYSTDNVTWTAITYASTDPAGNVVAFATDGEYVYAAFDSTGGVWRGKASATDWTQFSTEAGIVALAFAGGYLYGAKGGAGTKCEAGWFNSSTGAWTSLTAVLVAASTPVALSAVGNFVYLVTYNGSVSSVYTLQHSTDNTFELLATFPTGFRARCAEGYLGVLYIGGCYQGSEDTKGTGAVYLIAGSDMTLLFTLGTPDDDYRILSMSAYMKSLYFIAHNSVYVWSLENGGYSHYADIGVSNSSVFAWDVTETMTADPSAGWTVTNTANPPTATADGSGHLAVGRSSSPFTGTRTYKRSSADAALLDATGATVKFNILAPHSPFAVPSTQWALTFGTQTDGHSVQACAEVVYTRGTSYTDSAIQFGICSSGNSWMFGSPIASPPGLVIHEVLLSTKGGLAWLLVNGSSYLGPVNTDTCTGDQKPFFIFGDANGNTTGAWDLSVDGYAYSNDGPDPSISSLPFTTTSVYSGAAVAGVDGAGTYIGNNGSQLSGYLESSVSSFHMPSVQKYFRAVDVSHLPGAGYIRVETFIDGKQSGDDTGMITVLSGEETSHTWLINKTGSNVKTKITLQSLQMEYTWPFSHFVTIDAPVITSSVVRFVPHNSRPLHIFILDCRDEATLNDDSTWDQPAKDALDFLLLKAASGEVCTFQTFYGETFFGRIEDIQLLGTQNDASERQGSCQMQIRALT